MVTIPDNAIAVLVNGPHDGKRISAPTATSIIIPDDDCDKFVSRYRLKRNTSDPYEFHFDGWDKVIATIPQVPQN